jgi:hypothetical protein
MELDEQTQQLAAKVNHEVMVALAHFYGDDPKVPWDKMTEDEKHHCFVGVKAITDNPKITPNEIHEVWMKERLAEGWRYGPVLDPVKKTSPCLTSYLELPDKDKMKDHIFIAIVKAFL